MECVHDLLHGSDWRDDPQRKGRRDARPDEWMISSLLAAIGGNFHAPHIIISFHLIPFLISLRVFLFNCTYTCLWLGMRGWLFIYLFAYLSIYLFIYLLRTPWPGFNNIFDLLICWSQCNCKYVMFYVIVIVG